MFVVGRVDIGSTAIASTCIDHRGSRGRSWCRFQENDSCTTSHITGLVGSICRLTVESNDDSIATACGCRSILPETAGPVLNQCMVQDRVHDHRCVDTLAVSETAAWISTDKWRDHEALCE